MNLLGTDSYRDKLASLLSLAETEVIVFSAYTTIFGCKWIENHTQNSDVKVSLITRWKPNDLVSGASDLASYEFAIQHGWDFSILRDLHAKAYLIDRNRLLAGSANATAYGLALVPGGNRELGVCIDASSRDIDVLLSMQMESVPVTAKLYQKIRQELDKFEKTVGKQPYIDWPVHIQNELLKPVDRLWVADMPWSSPTERKKDQGYLTERSTGVLHDLRLFGFSLDSADTDYETMVSKFIDSRAFNWLLTRLNSSENRELYFGTLTAMLHNALLDDPSPYRRTVKELLANLMGWIQHLNPPRVDIDRPKHSIRVRLIEPQ